MPDTYKSTETLGRRVIWFNMESVLCDQLCKNKYEYLKVTGSL